MVMNNRPGRGARTDGEEVEDEQQQDHDVGDGAEAVPEPAQDDLDTEAPNMLANLA
jgi:hypothetical protein